MSSNPIDWFGPSASNRTRTSGMWIDAEPDKRQLLGIPEGGMPLEEFMKFGAQAPTRQEQPITPGFLTSVKRGSLGVAEDFANTGQLASQVMQIPAAAEYFNRKAEEYKVAQEKYPRAVPSIEDIHGIGDFGTWAVETFGEQVPILATFLIPGGVAGKAVSMAGKGQAAAKAAGLTAGFISDLGLMTGESVGIAKEAGQPIEDLRVVGSGLGKAMLDFIPFFTVAKQLGISGPIEKAILKHAVDAGYLKRAAGNAAVIMATEIPTETMQEWINVELDNYFTGYTGPMTEDQKSQLYNAAAGAALFGAFGAYAPRHPPPPGLTEEPEAEKNRQLLLGPPPPKTDFTFTDVPTGPVDYPRSGFDFRNLYDAKTGELRTTATDYMRIVKEQTQVKYDPLTDMIKQPPSSATYTTVTPGWQERGGSYYLDAPTSNVDAGKAQIVPGPNGFEAWDVYGASLGVYPDLTSAMVGATNAVYSKGRTFVFDQDGMHITGEPDGHTLFMRGITQPTTPIEMAAAAIEQSKPQKQPTTLVNPMGEAEVSAISNDADLMKLIDVRNEFINNKDNYRTTDGEMKKTAVKQLAAIDARIARYTQVKGIPNINTSEVLDVTGTKLDETLAEAANKEAKAAEAAVYPNLTAFEQKLYAKLNDKEQFEGLEPKEWEEFQRLQQKIQTGKDTFGEYRPATKDELEGFSAEEKALITKVRKKRKYSKATRAIARMRGVQMAQNKTPKLTWTKAGRDVNAYMLSINGQDVGGIYEEEITDMGELERMTPEESRRLDGAPPMGWYAYDTIEEGGTPGGPEGPFQTEQEARVWLEKQYGRGQIMQARGEMSLNEAVAIKKQPRSERWVTSGKAEDNSLTTILYDKNDTQQGNVYQHDGRWYASATLQGYERVFDSKADAMEWLLQQTTWARPGWKVTGPNVDEIVMINEKANAAIGENPDGTFYAVKLDNRNNMWDLGTFATPQEALNVAEGASPQFVAEVNNALKNFWASFRIRPRLLILSTADILNNKVSLTQEERDNLATGRGIFVEGKPGTVMIHIDKHNNVEEVVETLVHEMIAHFGVRALLPVKYWDAILTAYAAYNRDLIAQLEKEGKSPGAVEMRSIGSERGADILTADEAIAYIAEEEYTGNPLKPFEQTFLDRVVAQMRAWFRWAVTNLLPKDWHAGVFKYVPFNRKDVVFLLKDAARSMRTSQEQMVDTTRHGRVHIQSAKGREVFDRTMDSFGSVWGAKTQGLFLSAIQFAERYNLPGVADYMGFVQKWAARKSSLQSMPVELLERWQLYNKRGSNRLAEALLYMTSESDKTGHALSDERRAQILKEHGVDEEGQAIFQEIRRSFLKTLDYLENGLIRQEIRRHVDSAEYAKQLFDAYMEDRKSTGEKSKLFDLLQVSTDPKLKNLNLGTILNKIAAEVNSMRDRDYFPYMRFGRYAVWVRAERPVVLDGKKYRGPTANARGQMVHFETFETYREAQEAFKSIVKEYGPNFKVGSGWVSDQEYTMLGMPPALYDTLSKELQLSDAQKEVLKEIYFTKSPGQRFLRNMVNRKGVRGFSTDAIRVYSSYMLNAASHIARIEYGQDIDQAITAIRNYAQDAGIVSGHVRSYWEDHYKYIMNPENDWAGLRAVGFLWYLGFNVKSAAVNMTQVPMVALPYLGARFGDQKALAAITSAYKDAFKILRGKGIPTGDMEAAIQQGIEEGFLDESLATVLAGFSESSVLQRMLPESDAQRRLNQVAWAGSWMFQHVEKINRYVTFLAARKLALEKNGGNKELAFAEAKEAVQSSMFEYAKWNRAPFMRGKKSVFFLFWSYMQGLAYLMGGGKGSKVAMRVWMMMLLAAGLQGVPFAENILDLIDWGSKEMKELMGSDDPYTNTRMELRKFASTITDNPDMLLHGWSRHYGLGPLHLLSLAGVPVPEVDISGSMSAGRWLPGTDKLTSGERDPDKKFGQTLVDVLGPVAGVGYGLFSALVDNNPDSWKKWERAMPSALKGMSQGLRREEKGGEEFRGGGKLAVFDPTNPEDRTALWLNMLAFQPTKVGQAYEVIGAKENLRRYWSGRQAMVMENWAFAMRGQDPEVMADAREAMRNFNEDVPDPQLRLTPEKIRRSMKARAKRIQQREMGLPNEKGYRRLYEEIDQIYGLQST